MLPVSAVDLFYRVPITELKAIPQFQEIPETQDFLEVPDLHEIPETQDILDFLEILGLPTHNV